MNYFLKKRYIFLFIGAGFRSLCVNAQDHLEECIRQQAVLPTENHLDFSFREFRHLFYHSFEPWQQLTQSITGTILLQDGTFLKKDSMQSGKHTYTSSIQLDSTSLLRIDYGDTSLSEVSRTDLLDQILESARYTPAHLLQYTRTHPALPDSLSNREYAVYRLTINKKIVRFYVRKSDDQLSKITILDCNDLYGDINTTLTYSDYRAFGSLQVPQHISIDKINGKLQDEVIISNTRLKLKPVALMRQPADFAWTPEKIPTDETVTIEPYNDHIYFLRFKVADSRAMVVVFPDYLLVAEAPLNSENGERIIKEAQRIAPGKSIKYFVYSHFHNSYSGGIRAFIHKGITVLCAAADTPYLQYLAETPHTLHPDSQAMEPKALQTETISDTRTFGDSSFRMVIRFIGEQSKHTRDYLLYYFPEQKLCFEGDLAWIPETGATEPAGALQEGLYHAIRSSGFPVETVMQSWPLANYGVKTTIPFSELEATIPKSNLLHE